MQDLASNLADVQTRIAAAAERAARGADEITLVAVTKTFSPETIVAGYELGLRHFGENRVEEGVAKIPSVNARLPRGEVSWHMIGHLQSRKVKHAVPIFDVIHSVDSVTLAKRLDNCAGLSERTIPILLEVNVSGESTKFGFSVRQREQFFSAAREILNCQHLKTIGLMTLAPIVSDPENARPYFRALREMRDELRSRISPELSHLSMGMTDDFEAAIAEGATMLRIGRAIFGERQEK